MSPPFPRKFANRNLPAHLYERGGYFAWRDPRTGREHGLGRDRESAVDQAIEANRFLDAQPRLVDAIKTPVRTIAGFADAYRGILDSKKLARNSLRAKKSQIVRVVQAIGDVRIGARQEEAADITRRIAEWLNPMAAAGKASMARELRTLLVDMFGEMAAAGWISVNPAAVLRIPAPTVRRARLTLDTFQRIYAAADALYPWVRRSMELGLVSLQRRDDIASLTFRDVQDARLCVVQEKTGARLRIPVALRLDAVGWQLGDIIINCRDDVLSPHMLHHARHQGQAKPGMPVHPQTITGAFREARTLAGIEAEPGKTPPTFHELRSLGIRLYQQQGYDPQALAGHRDAATTAIYKDARGAEWIDVAA